MNKNKIKKADRKRITFLLIPIILFTLAIIWIVLRHTASVTCTAWTDIDQERYSESAKVFSAMSLSYLVYGCETCDNPSGTVSEMLDTKRLGIVIENADILRTNPTDPSTALIDSSSFIRQAVGSYRLVADLKDERSSFYGAAFADDKDKVIWIAYSGSVSLTDALQCMLLAIGPTLSRQEKHAFELYETVLAADEIQNGYDLILTGHSLGGALASMVSYMSGAKAITISGADGVALSKIKGIEPDRSDSCNITNYMTWPNDFDFSFKDCLQRLMFWGDYSDITCHIYQNNGMVDNSHCVFGFIEFEDGSLATPRLPRENERSKNG